MKLALAGINHRTAPVEIRESLAFRAEELPDALHQLRELGTEEALILSTCNRVEVTATMQDSGSSEEMICDFLARSHQLRPESIRPHLYVFEESAAIRHLFRVASSLDSMIVGEPQILGQLKRAYEQAREAGAIGTYLDTVLTRAFNVAKRVRSETEIGQSAVSVSFAAVEMAREIFGSLHKKRVMLIGAGKMSEAAARHLQRAGVKETLIANRTPERAEEMARLFEGTVVPYESFATRLQDIDIVIASSAAPGYLITPEQVRKALEARRNQPVFFIDIAVPRNIDPAVNDLEHAFLYDIDDLQRLVDRNLQGRRDIAGQAEEIVSEEVARLLARLRSRDLAPTIVGLQEQFESIRREVLERYRPKLGSLQPGQEDALEAMTRAMMNKIAHGPISEMRRMAAEQNADGGAPSGDLINLVRRAFRLRESGRDV